MVIPFYLRKKVKQIGHLKEFYKGKDSKIFKMANFLNLFSKVKWKLPIWPFPFYLRKKVKQIGHFKNFL